ncbi:hypothetical protein [Agrobacterium radiobacter]|uniref:hypothetical protein n=1 Tax=Agrobacterium radiobacter TaxID=362 RepID=UPI003CE4820D
MKTELSIDRSRSPKLLADWRAKMSFSRLEAAKALEMDEDAYNGFESGLADLPVAIWRKCQALSKGSPIVSVPMSLPRDRWVRMVDNSLAFLENEHHISSLIREERWEEVADFMDYMRVGPDMDMAMTDPHLFRQLREAGTRAFLSGLMHFKGPKRPFPDRSFRKPG